MALVDQYNKPIKSGNYSSTRYKLTRSWTRPRYVTFGPDAAGFKSLAPGEKSTYHALARDLFRSSNTIRSAITRKNGWAAASGWTPYFCGKDADYGKLLISHLVNKLDQCNTAGPNYTFNRTLVAIANEIDVGGDCPILFVKGRDGNLRMSLYPSNVVGQRVPEKTVTKGRYSGNDIYDGVVYDSNFTPIAFSFLQENKGDDFFVAARNALLPFEPEEGQMFRGISVIVASLLQFLTQQDIEDYQTRTIALQSKMGIIAGVKGGIGKDYIDGYSQGYLLGTTEDTTYTGISGSALQPVIADMGDYVFVDSKNNESMQSFEPKQPGGNVGEWTTKIEEKCLYGIGWHLALISPNTIGSYAARVMESQVQQMIVSRQQTLSRVANLYALAVIANDINSGELPAPKNATDWRAIDFHMPPLFQIDSWYGNQTAMQQWQTGNNTLQNITAAQGIDWLDLRTQRELEADDALQRASNLVAKYPALSLERALDLISKQSQNAAPIQEQITDATGK